MKIKKLIFLNLNKIDWKIAIYALFFWNCFLLLFSGKPQDLQIYHLLLIYGLLFLITDNLKSVKISRNNLRIFIGLIILTITIIRGSFSITDNDLFSYISLPLITFAMTIIVNLELKEKYFFKLNLISSFLIIRAFLRPIITFIILPLTSNTTWLLNNLLGIKSFIYKNIIYLNYAGINILEGCSGAEQIVYQLTLASILLILYPIKKHTLVVILILFSILVGFTENIVRLSILSTLMINNNPLSLKIFDFLHISYGGLIFALFSSIVTIKIFKNLKQLDQTFY